MKYNLSEDWNSPGNLAIAHSLPSSVQVFSVNDNDVANYLAISDGEEWPSEKSLKARMIRMGRDRFLLIEYPDSGVFWTEPRY